jgi:riboflavin synthase
MFTGIIEETGTLVSRKLTARGWEVLIKAKKVLAGTKLGDSICVDGVCLTVAKLVPGAFAAQIMPATGKETTLKKLRISSKLNLERALAVGDRLGGHIVQGHVDGIGKVKRAVKSTKLMKLEITAPAKLRKFIVPKGSIAINGVSLTVQDIKGNAFTVGIIPHTAKETNLMTLRAGSEVNLETDVLLRGKNA